MGLKGSRRREHSLWGKHSAVPAPSEDMSVKPSQELAEILEQETGDLQALGKGEARRVIWGSQEGMGWGEGAFIL